MINKNEKKYVYIALGLISIILIFVIILIWFPMFKDKKEDKEITSANYYEYDSYVEKMKEEYKKVVLEAINIDNYDNIKAKVNEEYLKQNNMDTENLKAYLVDNDILKHPSNTTIVYNSCVRTDGEKYIYTYKYKVGNDEKKIHIIEDYYKSYSISFEQESYPILKTNIYDVFDENGIEYKISYYKSYENMLLLKINIINNTTEEFKYNITTNTDSSIIYNGDTRSFLTNVIIGEDYSLVNSVPGGNTTIILSYEIALENQDIIQALELNDITKSDGSRISVKLDLK